MVVKRLSTVFLNASLLLENLLETVEKHETDRQIGTMIVRCIVTCHIQVVAL
jgi:hypothetical protein